MSLLPNSKMRHRRTDFKPIDLRGAASRSDTDLAQLANALAWTVEANCRNSPLNMAYGFDTSAHSITYMRLFIAQYCVGCPVTAQCLAEGIDDKWGVWGGLVPEQRQTLKASMKSGSDSTTVPSV